MTRALFSRLPAFSLLAVLAGVPAAAFASGQPEEARALIASGHAGAVRAMEYDDARALLFTSGADGTVRIWDPAAGDLLRTLQITQLSAGRLAVNPASPQLAVVVTDGSGQSSLAVWDWQQERQLYRVALKEEPLFLRFSPLGTYVLYGESSWQSLKIIQADTGAPVPFHPEGFGIVGFAEMSRSEKTVMTYQVSGRISYWDLATGAQTLDVPTVAYLSALRISQDRSVLVGCTSSEIVRVDAVSGEVRGRAQSSGTLSLDISAAGDEVSAIAGSGQLPARWSVSGDSLTAASPWPRLHGRPSLLVYGSDSLYVADATGALEAITETGGDITEFGKNAVATLTGFDVGSGVVALGSRLWVRLLSIEGLGGSALPTAIHTILAPNPFSDDAGLAFLDPGLLIAWGTGSGNPGLALLDTRGAEGQTRAFSPVSSAFRAPLADLSIAGGELIGVEKGGMLRIVDPRTGVSRFDSRLAGATAAVRVSPAELIAARNSAGAQPGSLVRLNPSTGETVTIRDRNLFTYALLLDPDAASGPTLYSVGVDAERATNLLRHDGPGFEHETLLDSVPEEYLDGTLSLDPDDHVLFATLGQDRAVSWDGRALTTLSLQNTMPRRLIVRSGLAFCLNKDSTVTVADVASGARLADIALFLDGEWCIVFADGHYAASTGGDMHVRVFANGTPLTPTEDFRLRIDAR